MIYRPPEPYRLWDTWLYPWEGRFHLFYLRSDPPRLWDHIGHAVSTDLVHWEDCEPIPTSGPEGEWDHGPTLTGMVVRQGDRFWMFYGAAREGVQRIGLMVSDDLHSWRKAEQNPVLVPGRPYQAGPRPPFGEVDWRDACAVWREEAQAWEAYICARREAWDEDDSGACVARVRSRDLIHWDLLPAAATVGGLFLNAEVPDHFELAGRRYLLFSTITGLGRRLDTPSRERCAGTFYVVAEGGEDYRIPSDPLLLGAGSGRFDGYVGRTIAWEDGRLLYHHLAGPRPSWGLPKRVRAGEGGALWLEYWPGAARLEAGVWEGIGESHDVEGLGQWQRRDGELSGRSGAAASAYLLRREAGDFQVSCEIEPAGCERAGLVFRVDQESRRGLALVLDWRHGRVEMGGARRGYGWALSPLDSVRWPLRPGKGMAVRVLARAEFVEAYVNDRWVFSTVVPEEPQRGLLGFAVEGGQATFRGLRCAELEPLA